MTIKRISSGPGLPAGFPFSLASEGNGILFISGMPALDKGRRRPDQLFRCASALAMGVDGPKMSGSVAAPGRLDERQVSCRRRLRRTWLDEAAFVGEHDGLDPVPELQFGQDTGYVGLDGRFAEE